MLGDEPLELSDELHVTAERELGFDSLLDGCQADLVEPLYRDLSERLVGEVGERWSPPEVERIREEARSGACIPCRQRSGRLLRATLEASQIELVGGEPDDVSGGAGLDRGRTEHLAELGDLPLHLRHRRDRSCPRVQVVGESSTETTRFASRSKIARVARCFGPPSEMGPSSPTTSSGPRMRNSSTRADGSRSIAAR